ncbi:MAG TPA: hypothetical protein VEL76_34840, partial [Gemmataceae bacterium]|nr:hypothetical protein [Gemmataceae bacterium]
KYFTPDLIQRGNSLDDDVADAANDEWERAIVRSNRRWKTIRNAFPKAVQRFDENQVCLHDAQLLSMGRQGDTFVMVLQPEPPAQTMVLLTFTLDDEPVIDTKALPDRENYAYVTWMYEEFDLDRRKRCTFEVLLSNGWSVKLLFRDFQYLITQQLFPVPQVILDPAFAQPQPPVSQPA